MKISSLLLLSLPLCATSKRVFDLKQFKSNGGLTLDKRLFDADGQLILKPLFAEPQKQELLIPDNNGESPQDGPTLLTSSIATNKQISLFASYVRDDVEISQKFNSKKSSSIVLAPKNSAIESLPLKPWQFPIPLIVGGSQSEKEIDEIISSNTNDFVSSHVIDGTVPFDVLENSEKGVQLVTENGKSVKLVNDEGDYYVAAVNAGTSDDWIKVETVVNVDNGVLLMIGKSLSYPQVL